jgi:Zn-dependent M16 (insulinase) family peptidase
VVHTRLGAHFHESGWFSEHTSGVSSLFFTRHLAETIDQDWPSVLAKLEAIRRMLVNRNGMLCNVTVDNDTWEQFHPKLVTLLDTLPSTPVRFVEWTPPLLPRCEGLTIPTHVNYVAKGMNLYTLGYQHHGSIAVINNYLRTTWLWDKVRVQGGAYGGFCLFDRRSGMFSYLSYRDPNVLQTLETYDQAAQFLRHTDVNEQELTKSIIGVIGQLDSYQLPDAKGYTSMARYLIGETDDMLQQIRDEVLSTTDHHFKAFAGVLKQVQEQGFVVIMGSQEAIEQVNSERHGWLETVKVL